MDIYEISNKLKGTWNPEVRAIIDTWTNYMISDEEFRTAVFIKGIPYAKANNGQAWIVDSSKAKGLFRQSHFDIINHEILPAFKKNGIKYFITIKPENSVFTELTVGKYSAMVDSNGLNLIEVSSVEQAILWLKNHN